jgi:hypothetical protein
MFTANKVRYLLVAAAVAFSINDAYADPLKDAGKALGGAAQTITKTLEPPHVDVQYDPKKPLVPPTIEAKKDGASVSFTPSSIPAPPVIHAPGNGFFANVVNQANDLAQKPKIWIEQKGREINAGWLHLCDEIGMMWANFKHDMEQKVFDFLAWLKALAEKYAVLALAGIGALFLVRSFFHLMFGRRPRHA